MHESLEGIDKSTEGMHETLKIMDKSFVGI